MQRLSIALHDVSVRRGDRWALRNVSWRLRPGERWALLGANGAGKTQLLKVLSGTVWPTPRALHAGGRIYRRGGKTLSLVDARIHVAYVGGELQDKYARYGWDLSVQDLVATGLHGTDLLLSPVTTRQAARVAEVLRACGLQRHARRRFLTLSYGEKRLALLARAIAPNPDWLLLDEFYNGLDHVYRKHIDALLAKARGSGQSWVASAHRAADVPRGTRLTLGLDDGGVSYCKRLGRDHLVSLARRAGEPRAGKPRAGEPSAPSVTSMPVPPVARSEALPDSVLMDLRSVDLYVDYRLVLGHLNWQMRRGEHWAVIGANGSGKSSFLKLLHGDLSPALGGRIERLGRAPGTPIGEWKRRVGLVSPELQTSYLVDVTLMELVASARFSSIGLADPMTRADERRARKWLRFFELLPLAKRRPRDLSYGQMRLALIARAMAADASILLLDEPLTGLDPEHRAAVKLVLRRLMRNRVSVIAAVHHLEDLPGGITHALHLHNRRARQVHFQTAT